MNEIEKIIKEHRSWNGVHHEYDTSSIEEELSTLIKKKEREAHEKGWQSGYTQGKEDFDGEKIRKEAIEGFAIQVGLKDNPETLQDNGYYAISVHKDEVEQYLKEKE